MRVLGVVLIMATILLVIALVIWCTPKVARGVAKVWRYAVERRRRKADRTVPWEAYSTPVGDHLEIGVERRTDGGRLLGRVHMVTVSTDDEMERMTWESQAQIRAQSYNESKVGM